MICDGLKKELRQLGIEARPYWANGGYWIEFSNSDDLNLWKMLSVFSGCWDIDLKVKDGR